VLWEDERHYNVDGGGKSILSKTVSVIIPLEADTGGKAYVTPACYANLPAGDLSRWTLAEGDTIVYGECPAEITGEYTVRDLKWEYKTAEIQSVADYTNAPMLPHWETGGK
jgi:hypothetical protein